VYIRTIITTKEKKMNYEKICIGQLFADCICEEEKGAGNVAGIFRIRTLEGEIKINWI